MSKNCKPRRNPNPQSNVATEQQFVEAMEYVTAHADTVQALYSARADKGNQCFVLIDYDNTNDRALIGAVADVDSVNQYVGACRADGVRPWILVLVPDASVRTLTGIEATGLRAGLGCRPNLIPVVALSLPAAQVYGWLPEVTEARPSHPPGLPGGMVVPSIN